MLPLILGLGLICGCCGSRSCGGRCGCRRNDWRGSEFPCRWCGARNCSCRRRNRCW